jgi:hypothetical protein
MSALSPRGAITPRGGVTMVKNGGEETVWFSALCAAFAFMAMRTHPGIGTSMIFIVLLSWALWSIYKMLLERI